MDQLLQSYRGCAGMQVPPPSQAKPPTEQCITPSSAPYYWQCTLPTTVAPSTCSLLLLISFSPDIQSLCLFFYRYSLDVLCCLPVLLHGWH